MPQTTQTSPRTPIPRRPAPALLARAAREIGRRDPAMRAVMRSVGPCGLRYRGDPYRYLVRAILYQQITGKAARAIETRFKGAYGGRIPDATTLRRARVERLRGFGLSRQKAQYMREIATAFDEGRVKSRTLGRMSDEEVIATVTEIKGVGVWTAHMLLMFSLGRLDILPTGDLGIVKGAQLVYELDALPKPAELEAIGDAWRPYRSVASWYLWRALDPDDED